MYDHSFRLDTDAQSLWDTLGDVPVDDDGKIEEPFLEFPTGTDREEIWHWFEDSFDVSVYKLIKGIR